VFVFSPNEMLMALEELAAEADEEEGLQDLGTALLPHLVSSGGACEHRFDGYWRDVGTIASYWESQRDLLADDPPIKLDEPAWPVVTSGGLWAPAHVYPSGSVHSSLLSPGTRICGSVESSVLSPGVVVEEGATVRDSVLLHDVVVRAGAAVERSIVDTGAEIGSGARVGAVDHAGRDGEGITLVGQGAAVDAKAELKPGARWPDEDGMA